MMGYFRRVVEKKKRDKAAQAVRDAYSANAEDAAMKVRVEHLIKKRTEIIEKRNKADAEGKETLKYFYDAEVSVIDWLRGIPNGGE
jgi:hypothetical protein